VGCLNPLEGWRSRELNENGRRPAVFNHRSADLDLELSLPCGKCLGCKKDKATAWGLRCHHEATQHLTSCFVTLTYSDPAPPTLNKKHLQDFFKRLRKAGETIRYFACGEYGTQTNRPHYHAIFFGNDFRHGSVVTGVDNWTNPKIQTAWGWGSIMIKDATPEACFYAAGYMLKDDKEDSFHLQSSRPGIGYGWLNKYSDDIARNGFVTVDGRKIPVPRAYLARPDHAMEFEALKDRRSEYIRTMDPEQRVQLREGYRGKEINLRAQSNLRGYKI